MWESESGCVLPSCLRAGKRKHYLHHHAIKSDGFYPITFPSLFLPSPPSSVFTGNDNGSILSPLKMWVCVCLCESATERKEDGVRLVRTHRLSGITLKRILLFPKSVEQRVQLQYFIHAGSRVQHSDPFSTSTSPSTLCVSRRKSPSCCDVASIKLLSPISQGIRWETIFSILLSTVQQRRSSYVRRHWGLPSFCNCLFKSSSCLMHGKDGEVEVNMKSTPREK